MDMSPEELEKQVSTLDRCDRKIFKHNKLGLQTELEDAQEQLGELRSSAGDDDLIRAAYLEKLVMLIQVKLEHIEGPPVDMEDEPPPAGEAEAPVAAEYNEDMLQQMRARGARKRLQNMKDHEYDQVSTRLMDEFLSMEQNRELSADVERNISVREVLFNQLRAAREQNHGARVTKKSKVRLNDSVRKCNLILTNGNVQSGKTPVKCVMGKFSHFVTHHVMCMDVQATIIVTTMVPWSRDLAKKTIAKTRDCSVPVEDSDDSEDDDDGNEDDYEEEEGEIAVERLAALFPDENDDVVNKAASLNLETLPTSKTFVAEGVQVCLVGQGQSAEDIVRTLRDGGIVMCARTAGQMNKVHEAQRIANRQQDAEGKPKIWFSVQLDEADQALGRMRSGLVAGGSAREETKYEQALQRLLGFWYDGCMENPAFCTNFVSATNGACFGWALERIATTNIYAPLEKNKTKRHIFYLLDVMGFKALAVEDYVGMHQCEKFKNLSLANKKTDKYFVRDDSLACVADVAHTTAGCLMNCLTTTVNEGTLRGVSMQAVAAKMIAGLLTRDDRLLHLDVSLGLTDRGMWSFFVHGSHRKFDGQVGMCFVSPDDITGRNMYANLAEAMEAWATILKINVQKYDADQDSHIIEVTKKLISHLQQAKPILEQRVEVLAALEDELLYGEDPEDFKAIMEEGLDLDEENWEEVLAMYPSAGESLTLSKFLVDQIRRCDAAYRKANQVRGPGRLSNEELKVLQQKGKLDWAPHFIKHSTEFIEKYVKTTDTFDCAMHLSAEEIRPLLMCWEQDIRITDKSYAPLIDFPKTGRGKVKSSIKNDHVGVLMGFVRDIDVVLEPAFQSNHDLTRPWGNSCDVPILLNGHNMFRRSVSLVSKVRGVTLAALTHVIVSSGANGASVAQQVLRCATTLSDFHLDKQNARKIQILSEEDAWIAVEGHCGFNATPQWSLPQEERHILFNKLQTAAEIINQEEAGDAGGWDLSDYAGDVSAGTLSLINDVCAGKHDDMVWDFVDAVGSVPDGEDAMEWLECEEIRLIKIMKAAGYLFDFPDAFLKMLTTMKMPLLPAGVGKRMNTLLWRSGVVNRLIAPASNGKTLDEVLAPLCPPPVQGSRRSENKVGHFCVWALRQLGCVAAHGENPRKTATHVQVRDLIIKRYAHEYTFTHGQCTSGFNKELSSVAKRAVLPCEVSGRETLRFWLEVDKCQLSPKRLALTQSGPQQVKRRAVGDLQARPSSSSTLAARAAAIADPNFRVGPVRERAAAEGGD